MKTALRLSLVAGLVAAMTGSPAWSQAPDAARQVKLDVDHATFAYDDASSLLEVYLAIGSGTLEYVADTVGLVAALPIYARMNRATVAALDESAEEIVWADSVLLQFALPDSSYMQEGQHFLHQLRAAIGPGEYVLTITIPAHGGRTQDQVVTRDLVVPDFASETTTVSDVQLASSISRATDRSDEFYKNGLSIKPNPYILFGSNLPRLFYYVETYNTAAAGDTAYSIYSFISKSTVPQPVGELSERVSRPTRSPDAIVGSFDISSLPSGSYLLNLILLDPQNRSLAEQTRKFFVYNPTVAATPVVQEVDLAYEEGFYAAMEEDELDEQIRYAQIIATERERDMLGSAKNAEGKRNALLEFWTKRDPDPTTPINETREEYFSRVQFARERYSNTHSAGWQTDRGRVYLKYGTPAHVNPHHYERGMAPYEIWEYDNIPGEGRSIFVFGDVSGFNEFELIHSDVTGERQSVNWRAELQN